MKNKVSIHKEYKIIQSLSFFLTGLYFIVGCIILYNEKVAVPDSIEFIAAVSFYCLPILILLCWYMCCERYMQLSLEAKEEHEREAIFKGIKSVITRNVYWGVGFCGCLWVNAFFLIRYSETLGELYYYYGIVLLITVIWFLGLLTRHKRVSLKKFYYLVFAVISVILLLIAIERANAFVFIQKMNMLTI